MRHKRITRPSSSALCVKLFLSFCAPVVDAAVAKAPLANLPILIVVEDEDPNSLRRSSSIAKRMATTLKSKMNRKSFHVLDEEAVAEDLEWKVRDRRPKMGLFQLPKLLSKSGKAEHQVRAMVLYRTYVAIQGPLRFAIVQVRIECDVYDLLSNQFVEGLSLTREYPAPTKCDYPCILKFLGDRAREIVGSLGTMLEKKLARYYDVSTGGNALGPVTEEAHRRGLGSGHTTQIPYVFTLRNFERIEALAIIGFMAEEFPGYKTHSSVRNRPCAATHTSVPRNRTRCMSGSLSCSRT